MGIGFLHHAGQSVDLSAWKKWSCLSSEPLRNSFVLCVSVCRVLRVYRASYQTNPAAVGPICDTCSIHPREPHRTGPNLCGSNLFWPSTRTRRSLSNYTVLYFIHQLVKLSLKNGLKIGLPLAAGKTNRERGSFRLTNKKTRRKDYLMLFHPGTNW